MKIKRLILFLLLITAVVVGCAAEITEEAVEETTQETAEEEALVVVVTRVVTETTIESEPVDVTRIVTEVEEEATDEEAEIVVESEAPPITDPETSVGSEVAGSAPPPPPSTGPKVTSSEDSEDDLATPIPTTDPALLERVGSPDGDASSDSTAADSAAATSSETPPREDDLDALLENVQRLAAGEVDDNAQWDNYLLYLRQYQGPPVIEVNISERHQIWVRDSQERPILGARIDIEAEGQPVTSLRTHSNGLAYFFPYALNEVAPEYTVNVIVNDLVETFTLVTGTTQREWVVSHSGGDTLPKSTQLDILFLVDATGSMADEINELKSNILAISAQIEGLPAQPDIRLGMVAYRDEGEAYVTRLFDFTDDINTFADNLNTIEADGGGNYPEALDQGLFQALNNASWRSGQTVSLIFLVADAPPHLNQTADYTYATEMVGAAKRGIKIYPIASSGLDEQGEYIFRQLAQFSGGRFIFLTYDDPETQTEIGSETDLTVTDYTVSALDALVVQIVAQELSYRIE